MTRVFVSLGIFIGVVSAVLQFGSYVFSAKFMRETGKSTFSLMAPAFAVMSMPALLALPFFMGPDVPPLSEYALAALLCMACNVAGSTALFFMLKTVDASRVTPLLAIKVPMLALFFFAMGIETYSAWQWIGVALVVPAAWFLCKSGRMIPPATLAWLVCACACFGGSDYYIKTLLDAFGGCGSLFRVSMLAFLAAYASGGIFGAVGLLCGFVPTRAEFVRHVLPFSCFWFFSLALLFVSFAMLGIINGTIVQSARGLFAVVAGWFIARAGFEKLEEKVPLPVFIKRTASALLIILAVLLFNLCKK